MDDTTSHGGHEWGHLVDEDPEAADLDVTRTTRPLRGRPPSRAAQPPPKPAPPPPDMSEKCRFCDGGYLPKPGGGHRMCNACNGLGCRAGSSRRYSHGVIY